VDGSPQPYAGAVRRMAPITLIACTGVSILATDLYTPSLPHLPALLGTDAVTVQLTMSLHLFAYAFAQLVHGPLSDRFGRRRLLIGGLVGFTLASFGCALATDIDGLIAARIIQGVFGSVQAVVVLVIIRELYGPHDAVRLTSYYGMAIGLVPAVGPLIGGYVFLLAGWRANFYLLGLLSAGALVMVLAYVPESLREPRRSNVAGIVAAYVQLLVTRDYMRNLLAMAAIFGGLFAFITAAPFVLIERLGIATQHYGYYSALIVLAFIAGGFCASRLAARVRAADLVTAAVVLSLLGGGLMLLPVLLGIERLWFIVLPMCVYTFSIGLILAGGPTAMFDAVGNRPLGSASALAGALEMIIAALASLAVGLFYDGTALPMVAVCFIMAATAAVGYFGLRRPRR